MDQAETASVEALYRALRQALRHGARAAQLLTYSHDLIELLSPARPQSGRPTPISVRAMEAEEIIRHGIAEIGGDGADALLIVLGLRAGTLEQTLDKRRQQAARLLGIQPVTFRRLNHEKLLLLNLAIEIYKILSVESR